MRLGMSINTHNLMNYLLSGSVLLMILISPSLAAAATRTGTYESAAIGDSKVVSFKHFLPLAQDRPAGTIVTYQFAGSKTNFTTWSPAQATTGKIDLNSVPELKDSRELKVRITMVSESSISPTLKGFSVNYLTVGDTPVLTATTPAAGVTVATNTPTKTATATVHLSDKSMTTQAQTTRLVATGGNLWVNLGLALLLSLLVTWFLVLRHPDQAIE